MTPMPPTFNVATGDASQRLKRANFSSALSFGGTGGSHIRIWNLLFGLPGGNSISLGGVRSRGRCIKVDSARRASAHSSFVIRITNKRRYVVILSAKASMYLPLTPSARNIATVPPISGSSKHRATVPTPQRRKRGEHRALYKIIYWKKDTTTKNHGS